MVRSVVFLLTLLINAHASFLSQELDLSINPCDDFYLHVCRKAKPEDFAISVKTAFEKKLADEALEIVENLEDPIVNLIVDIVKRNGHKDVESCFWGLNSVGKGLAYGKISNFAVECADWVCNFIVRYSKKNDIRITEKLSEVSNSFVKMMVMEFLEIVDKNGLYRSIDPLVSYPTDVEEPKKLKILNMTKRFAALQYGVEGFKKDLHEELLVSDSFAPYFNLVYSRLLNEKGVYLSRKRQGELVKLYNDVKEAIRVKINNSVIVNEYSRESINRYLNRLTTHVGVPRGFQDQADVERHIRRYQDHLKTFSTHGSCCLEKLAREIHLVRNQLILENNGSRINDLAIRMNFENSIHEHNSYYNGAGTYFLPAYIHPFEEPMSLGIKYGTLAHTMAHELFHGLGLNNPRMHLADLQDTEGYEAAKECYGEYYGSMCTLDKPVKCPNGAYKRDEGFADVEGARIVFSLLKKELKRQRRFLVDVSQIQSEAGYNELQWFFVTMGMMNCRLKTDREMFAEYLEDPHPRPTIRTIATIMQMPEFSEVFGCRKDQNMYYEKLCDAFPQSKKQLKHENKTANFGTKERIVGDTSLHGFRSMMKRAPGKLELGWVLVVAGVWLMVIGYTVIGF
ncbi:hypothetical protein L596_019841 [Steinernema carpocapsae]|uniref:Peptidase M13 C-terminal domain-containing protein n=1 Tax=Steinernema carpocapsae TaxID=34508 RepID=A0A4U5MRZ6_STECR|nr:hypothetical protein L596_019841 [Steinernema carpocapsae]